MAEKLSRHRAGTAPYGTDAVVLQAMAPCVIMGPGSIAVAHTPREHISLTALSQAVPVFMQIAKLAAAG